MKTAIAGQSLKSSQPPGALQFPLFAFVIFHRFGDNAINVVSRWRTPYPKAVQCLSQDLPELLAFLSVKTSLPDSTLRTTNAVERRFREVRRRTRPMGVFSDHTSIDRIMLSVFTFENLKQKTSTPFLVLTQNT